MASRLFRRETDVHRLHPFQNLKLIGPDDPVPWIERPTYRRVHSVADFILDDDRSYAAWFAALTSG
jgi:hypothetical protein